jgi:hypothetical protein
MATSLSQEFPELDPATDAVLRRILATPPQPKKVVKKRAMATALPLSGCKAKSADLWVVEVFTGDGTVRRRTLYRRRWQPRALITAQ